MSPQTIMPFLDMASEAIRRHAADRCSGMCRSKLAGGPGMRDVKARYNQKGLGEDK